MGKETQPEKSGIEINASPGDFDMLNGELAEAFQDFVQEGNIKGLERVARELFKKGRNEEAKKVLKKAYEISKSLDN
jgi:hypothetical protein